MNTRKIGMNRGKPRLWLEGAILSNNGFNHGLRYDLVRRNHGGFDLVICAEGKRKIAGTPGRPIVDINSGDILAPFTSQNIAVIECETSGILNIDPHI